MKHPCSRESNTYETLLKSARQLIVEAKSLASNNVDSKILNEIRVLVDELSRPVLSTETSVSPTIGEYSNHSQINLEDETHTVSNANSDFHEEAYQSWLNNHYLTEHKAQIMAERMMLHWKCHPHITIFINVTEKDIHELKHTLCSLDNQLYKKFNVIVISNIPRADDAEYEFISDWIQTDDPLFALNQSISRTTSDWITLIRAGDNIAHHGLFSLADYVNLDGNEKIIVYSDEDYVNSEGERSTPLFKPDLNIDYLRSYPYIGRFCLVKKYLLLAIGGYQRITYCCNEELIFKAIELKGESVIGHIADVLYHRAGNKDFILEHIDENEWREVVASHLDRSQQSAKVVEGYLPKTNRVLYELSGQPLVSVIIPTKNRPELIEPCVTSLFEVTEYQNFEVIIVDNGSDNEDVFYYYQQWQQRYSRRIRVLSYDHPFNFSAMNNYGAKEARGDYLLLLNNDIEVISDSWMRRMLEHAQRKDVGAVGARLLYPNGKLQHAGVVVGLADSAAHPGAGVDFREVGPMARYQVDQNFSAVTAACLMTRREVYLSVGGLDESDFKVLFNDVDYCLRLGDKGYRIVWTPYSTLVHKQSASLNEAIRDKTEIERATSECNCLLGNWRNIIQRDPAYNKNLSFHCTEYLADGQFSPSWDTELATPPRIFGLPQDYFGCGNYRVISPLNSLKDKMLAQTYIGPRQDIYQGLPPIPTITDIIRMQPETVYLQSVLTEDMITSLEQFKRIGSLRFVTDMDDLKTDLPVKNSNRKYIAKDIRSRLRRFLVNFDLLTVSTDPLREAYQHLVDSVVVVPNRIDSSKWSGIESMRRVGSKPRVGWVGAQQHQGDLEIIIDVVKQTAQEVDWIFMGMCLDELKPYVKEVHEFEVDFTKYPAKMASLNLDLAVAPLEIHPFNEAKSNLRVLEYGMLGWPVICTDIYPYQNAPVKRVKNTTADWLKAIRERVYDLDFAAKEGDRLRSWVLQHWILQDHLQDWSKCLIPDAVIKSHNHLQKIA